MMKDVVLGIDVGTSGVRIVASDKTGALLAMSKAPIAAPIQNSGRSLQDPKIWWQAVEQAFALLDLKGLNVLALAIDGTSGTILVVRFRHLHPAAETHRSKFRNQRTTSKPMILVELVNLTFE